MRTYKYLPYSWFAYQYGQRWLAIAGRWCVDLALPTYRRTGDFAFYRFFVWLHYLLLRVELRRDRRRQRAERKTL